MSTTKKYIQLDPISHILKRPDMYCGSIKFKMTDEYIFRDGFIKKTQINICPAISRIFIEILSNAIDNVQRSLLTDTPCKKIQVNIDKTTGSISIWNDGDVIPVEYNESTGCYNHSMIFGKLLTGSNYDDTEERIVAGRNGLGSKLCNVFSSTFKVEGYDPVAGKHITQVWKNNMRDTDGPIIKQLKKPKGFTCVTWIPDFSKFGITGYSDDIIDLFHRHVIDSSLISKISVSYNNEVIQIKNLNDYSRLFEHHNNKEKLLINTGTCEVLLTTSDRFEHLSFVNGVNTKLGGLHVDSWCESLLRPVVDKLNKTTTVSKTNTHKINISDVRNFFRIFVIATVVRPEFDGQEKNKLECPAVDAVVKPSNITSIMKWSVISDIKDIIKSKELVSLKKTEQKRSFCKIEGYDRANNSGGKYSSDCTLILCEGLSAKTYAVAGIQEGLFNKSGRDWFGILPLTGKILNVRNASNSSIISNKVVTNIIQTLGIKYDTDYTNTSAFSTLNYGKLLIMTDADCDGIHIEGLIINLFHALFPSILNVDKNFIVSMKTPIARVKCKKIPDKLFYDERNFNTWLKKRTPDDMKGMSIKYYKGLGTTKIEDVPDTFGLKMLRYVKDDSCNESIDKIFHKDFASVRKEWLSKYNPSDIVFSLDNQGQFTDMNISDFMSDEMIKFSHADCQRSIPSMVDGLKEAQRKILYCMKKRNLSYNGSSLKVAQLSGYTAEHSNYHHGEQNLQDTIISMANNFVGSNNIPLLFRDGQFGTRLDGGSDAASARYIYTKLDKLTEYIFRKEDDPILTYKYDDGDKVEPEYYVPIIPMLLVNGSVGIGTGWSTNIPCYNPSDLVTLVKTWLNFKDDECIVYDENGDILVSMLDEIEPWYRDFKGSIQKSGVDKFKTSGIINHEPNQSVITELPIGVWTNKFKDNCEDLIVDKRIKSMKNYSTPTQPNFVLKYKGDSSVTDKLKLHTILSTSNMVAFSNDFTLTKFNSIDNIIDVFCKTRYKFYEMRLVHQISEIDKSLVINQSKLTFVTMIVDGSINMINESELMIIQKLEDQNTAKLENSYNFLLDLPVRSLTENKVTELRNKISKLEQEMERVKGTNPKDLWMTELLEFETQYLNSI